jgi:hypothetical protein
MGISVAEYSKGCTVLGWAGEKPQEQQGVQVPGNTPPSGGIFRRGWDEGGEELAAGGGIAIGVGTHWPPN